MKLKNRIALILAGSISVTLLVVMGLINFSFDSYFNDYLRMERNMRFEKIVTDISSLINPKARYSLNELTVYLELYAQSEQVKIHVYDSSGQEVARFNSLDPNAAKNVDYIEKDYRFVQDNQVIGMMTLGYLDDSYINHRSQQLQRNLIVSIVVLGVLAVVASFFISFYFSRNLYHPIMQITNATKDIRNGNFNTKISDSDIIEIQALASNIKYLSGSLQSQENIRKNYAQDISHELRTPLTNLQLHLEAIKDEIIAADPETIDLLLEEIVRLNKLVDNLRDTFNESAKTIAENVTDFDLSDALNGILEKLHPTLVERDLNLEARIAEKVLVTMDKDKIVQIMYNLLTNAAKAIYPGGHIVVTLKEFPTNILISVRDDGIGISEEDQKHIFDRFYRVDNARNTKVGGTGLGLSITKNLVDSMGGHIRVNSKPGMGSEFIVDFPKKK